MRNKFLSLPYFSQAGVIGLFFLVAHPKIIEKEAGPGITFHFALKSAV
jgi:hypothetical protein